MIDLNGRQVDARAALRDLERADNEDSLYYFLKNAWPFIDASVWRDGWPVEAVAEHLQAVVDGDIRRLLINIPPRCGKSSICSVAFPAWAWTQTSKSAISGPQAKFLAASYANQLVLRDSVKCRRLIESAWYQDLWGDRFKLNSDQNTKSRFSNDKGGERLITSVGAAVTGEGGDCLPGWERVSTPEGYVPISRIKAGDSVLAFDDSLGKVVEKRVIATKLRETDTLYEIHTVSGHSFECTGDHRVFVEGTGYVRARNVGLGDGVLVERRTQDQATSGVRQMRRSGGKTAVRSSKGASARQPGRVLLEEMLFRSSCGKAGEALCGLWRAAQAQAHAVLFRRMRPEAPMGQPAKEIVSKLLQAFSWAEPALFTVLRGRRSLSAHEGRFQFQFQASGPVLQSVQGNAPYRDGAGRLRLSDMRRSGTAGFVGETHTNVFASTPHRREQPEQRPGELDHALPKVPQATPSWASDVVSRIEIHRGRKIKVHDIQVEGCSNFFAGGVLVHNCIIIDDANAANEAFSEANVEATKEWWDTVISTRLNDQKTGAYIVIQQRLAEDDLTGHILEKEADGWTHLCLPMRFEADRAFVTGIGWEDPRTEEGELLWPERFGEAEVKNLERALGPWGTAGQLQQRPEPKGGGIIKRDWWQLWPEASFPPMDFILASLDTAYTEKTTNDYSAITIWGVFSPDERAAASRLIDADGRPVYIDRSYNEVAPKLMLMHAWAERLEFHALVEKVAQTCRSLKVDKLIIENKASGISVAQEMRRLYGHEGFAVQLSDPKSLDKVSRLYSVQHLFADGMIYAPDKAWAEQVMVQTGQFPHGKHDDLVDTVSQAVRHLRDLGLLVRSIERAEEIGAMMTYPGGGDAPLYPA